MSAHQLTHHEEMQELLRKLAGPEGSVKARIGRAARKLSTPFNRVRDLWYADPRTRIRAEELEEARKAARIQIGTALHDIETLQARIESLEATVRALLAR